MQNAFNYSFFLLCNNLSNLFLVIGGFCKEFFNFIKIKRNTSFLVIFTSFWTKICKNDIGHIGSKVRQRVNGLTLAEVKIVLKHMCSFQNSRILNPLENRDNHIFYIINVFTDEYKKKKYIYNIIYTQYISISIYI